MRALLMVDVQKDFIGGSLAVPNAKKIIPFINEIADEYDLVIATMDWHPADHKSFAMNNNKKVGKIIKLNGIEQRMWPVHCVQNTMGATPCDKLRIKVNKYIYKGMNLEFDSYSGFADANGTETDLPDYLIENDILILDVVGITIPYCVTFTVLDGLTLGIEMNVLLAGCSRFGTEKEINASIDMMEEAGAIII